jgi:hypothetical protein
LSGLSVRLGTEALLLEAVLLTDRHVEDTVTRSGDRGLDPLLGWRLQLRVFAHDVLREHIVHG